MAIKLRITDGTTTVDFITSDEMELGKKFAWTLGDPVPNSQARVPVTEALPVHLWIDDDDDLALTMQKFHALQRQAMMYQSEPNEYTPVWYQRQLVAESGDCQFLVWTDEPGVCPLHFTPSARLGGWQDEAPAIDEGREGTLSITHLPQGEQTSAGSETANAAVSVLGGAVQYLAVTGDVPARLYRARFYDTDPGRNYSRFMIGARSDARAGGDASNFVALWELEDGTSLTDTSTQTVAGSSGGDCEQCTFATQTGWFSRTSLSLGTICSGANHAAFFGSFVVLMRAKVDAGTAQIKLEQRTSNANVQVFGPVVEVSATDYSIYNMGIITLPYRNLRAIPLGMFAASFNKSDHVLVWGRVKPGSATPELDMDCLVAIPCDEFFVYSHWGEVTNLQSLYIGVSPIDNEFGVCVDADEILGISPTEIEGSGVPVGDGRMFMICWNNDGVAPAAADTLKVGIQTLPSWLSLRGAE